MSHEKPGNTPEGETEGEKFRRQLQEVTGVEPDADQTGLFGLYVDEEGVAATEAFLKSAGYVPDPYAQDQEGFPDLGEYRRFVEPEKGQWMFRIHLREEHEE